MEAIPEWLAAHLNDEEKAKVAACFRAFSRADSKRDDLVALARDLEELEKRLIRENPEQLVDPDLEGRVLVCTVGMRPLPVILTTLLIRPRRLYLLHTRESRGSAEAIRDDPYVQALGLDPVEDMILRTISLTDAPENYEHLRRIVRENQDQEIVVDISGGVKVMGVSIAAAAFWLRIPVVYQLGEEVKNIVRPFSERLIRLENPFDFFGATELRSIERLFASGDYDAALSLTRNLRDNVGDVGTLGRLDMLEAFILVYRDWDAFKHSILEDAPERKLADRLEDVHHRCKRMRLAFADPGRVDQNIRFLREIEQRWEPNRRVLADPYRLVDIYASAQRRARAGKYDDAVARLYRCLEMAATLCLQEAYGIDDTRSPDLSALAQRLGGMDKLQQEFEKIAGYPLLPGRPLGLKDQMVLLALEKGNRFYVVAQIYLGMEKGNLLEKRNRSILAHGTVPVGQEEYTAFDRYTQEILSYVTGPKGRFDKMLAMATHPEIRVEL